MKRLAWLATSGLLVAYGLAGALGGCGNEAEIPAAGDDAGDDAASASSSSGSTSSSGGSSSGDVEDAATDAAADSGDAGSTGDADVTNPNVIACGSQQCNAATQVCCQTLNDAGCQAPDAPCQGVKSACDEAADCPGAEVCCAAQLGFGGAACDTACTGQERQLCKTNAECADGPCYVNTCTGGRKVQSCSKLPGCTQ
jgi:hypothetical protein